MCINNKYCINNHIIYRTIISKTQANNMSKRITKSVATHEGLCKLFIFLHLQHK